MRPKPLSILLLTLILTSCSTSKPDPTYATRVKKFGTPDLIADHTGGVSRYSSPETARSRPPRAYEVYYYLKDNKQIAFQHGAGPVEQPIPPTMEDTLANLARQARE